MCGLDSKETREVRWDAGQLFLVCVDNRFRVWAWRMIDQKELSDRIHGEAILLLDVAHNKAKERERQLQDTFLRHKVADLRAVCDPWHTMIEWDRLSKVR